MLKFPITISLIAAITLITSHCIAMPMRYVKKFDQPISFLGLGTVELGRNWGIGGKISEVPSEETAKNVLQTAMEEGVNVIDTAASYGSSEERIGKFIPQAKYHYILITKVGEHNMPATHPSCQIPDKHTGLCQKPVTVYDFSRQAIIKDVDQSLKKLHVKQLDVVLLHLKKQTAKQVLRKGEAISALQQLKKAGKIRFIGISVNGDAAAYAINNNPLDVLEIEYSLINQSNKPYIDLAYKKGMAVIIRGGLGTGLLTPYVKKHINDSSLPYGDKVRALLKLTKGDYNQLTALALAFLHQDPHISSVVIGADQPQFIKKDIKLLENFDNTALLEQAKNIVQHYKTPDSFTEELGERYFTTGVN